MNKKLPLFCATAFLLVGQLAAQTSFTNRTNLLKSTAVHSGVAIAVLDMNGDGLDDIVRLDQGTDLRIEYQTAPNQPFETNVVGNLTDESVWGICAADIDNNGYPDLLTGGAYDGIKIVMARPDGLTYTVLNKMDPQTFVQGVNFFDIDNDGWLDAFVCHDDGISRVFRNDGTGALDYDANLMIPSTFPASDNSGNYGTVWSDVDNNGRADLYIAKCRQGVLDPTDPRRINQLFLCQPDGTFRQDSFNTSGLRIGAQSWTADFGDIDNDGDMDCFITNHDVSSQLLINDGAGHFTDVSVAAGIHDVVEGSPIQGIFRDFDNDGYLDILVAGGDGGFNQEVHYLFHNNGNGTFTTLPGLFGQNSMESFAIGDLNHDGFPDIYGGYANIYTNPSNIPDAVWMNNGNDNHFLGIKLRGITSNRSGVGSRITLFTPQGKQIREVRSGESYGIMNSLAVQFGLGQHTTIDSVVVAWPSGVRDVIVAPQADGYLTLEEGGCLVEAVSIAAAGPTTFCTGQSVSLSAPAGFAHYLWNTGDTTSTTTATAQGSYRVTVTNAEGCTAVSNGIGIIVDPVETPEIVVTGDTLLCAGETVTLTASSGSAWTWSNGASTQSIQAAVSGTYTVAAQGLCGLFTSPGVKIRVRTPELPVPQNDVTWPGGPATLSAAGDEIHWFASQTGGTELAVGPTFDIPTLLQNTTLWVSNNDIEDRPNENTGMFNHTGTNGTNNFNGQIIFDALVPFRLHTVKVYSLAQTAKERQIDLLDAQGNLLQTKTISIPTGVNTITLDMDIPAGQNLALTTNEAFNLATLGVVSPQLRRADQGTMYPYVIPGVLNIKSSNAPGDPTQRYYYFFNWEVDFTAHECMSTRVPVQATVDPTMVGTDDLEKQNLLSIQPNPASEEVFVKMSSPASSDFSLQLLDAQGKLIRSQHSVMAGEKGVRIDLTGLPAGIYFLEMQDGGHVARGKFVKG